MSMGSLQDKIVREAVKEMTSKNGFDLCEVDFYRVAALLETKILQAVDEVKEKLTLEHRPFPEYESDLFDSGYSQAVDDLEELKKNI